jgi:hypothetical protein
MYMALPPESCCCDHPVMLLAILIHGPVKTQRSSWLESPRELKHLRE